MINQENVDEDASFNDDEEDDLTHPTNLDMRNVLCVLRKDLFFCWFYNFPLTKKTGHIVSIYHVINFVICRQPYNKSSNGLSVIHWHIADCWSPNLTKANLQYLGYNWGYILVKTRSMQTELLASERYFKQVRDFVLESVSGLNTNTSASERWNSVEQTLKSAVESTIGQTVPAARWRTTLRWHWCNVYRITEAETMATEHKNKILRTLCLKASS